ncbi:hypothetical protein [Pseudomonas aeruginosa]|uniref:hypothetical protein n=1 Tax=Pseudomonas aeruginosa TaxID=287 RepID=UPI002359AC6F|nr:hypothetical protein [Pseudomonas aeruginosa]
MIEASKLLQSNVDQMFRVDTKSKLIYVRLNWLLRACGTSVSLIPAAIEKWQESLLVDDLADRSEPLYFLSFLSIPDFIDSITDQLSVDGRETALAFKKLVQCVHSSSLVIDMARRSGRELPTEGLLPGVAALQAEIYKSAALIAAQGTNTPRNYGATLSHGYGGYSMTINQQPIH